MIAVSILNLWLFRFKKSTISRGGNAENLKQEFETYGFLEWLMFVVGGLEIILSLELLSSIYFSELEVHSAYGIAILMLGAIIMHVKVS